ncbi:MAG: nucleoside triphosphate pyrophosphohydrolase [Erysipelotrichia bacterium]|nr:nucleoside triphosphate pyrophosphohydrolase [Erysipelotrichia bacterium]
MTKIYNKLVRDKIPQIIEQDNKSALTEILSVDEYKTELLKKLIEESTEAASAADKRELIAELADVLEVFKAIMVAEDISWKEVNDIAEKKRELRGGFEKRIFLLKTWEK